MSVDSAANPGGLESLSVDVETLRRRSTFQQHVETTLDEAWVAQALSETDATVRGPARVDVQLMLPADGAVVVLGRLEVAYEVPCGRCLEPAAVDGSSEIQATYVVGDLPAPRGPRGEDEDEPGLGLSGDDLDVWTFDGRLVRLDAMLAEQIRLSYPMRALCALGEACAGLCSRCGANLNGSPGLECPSCGAPRGNTEGAEGEEKVESPLAAALRKVKLPV